MGIVGLYKGKKENFFSSVDFNVEAYEHYEKVITFRLFLTLFYINSLNIGGEWRL